MVAMHVKAVDPRGFKPSTEKGMCFRAAQFLDWARDKHPKQFVPWNVLLKACLGVKRTPNLNSRDVENLRNQAGRIRLILQSEYKRAMVTQPGIGCRASTDADDTLTHDVTARARRVVSAQNTLRTSIDLVKTSELSAKPEMKQLRDWFTRDVRQVGNQIDGLLKRLLPPAKVSESEDEG